MSTFAWEEELRQLYDLVFAHDTGASCSKHPSSKHQSHTDFLKIVPEQVFLDIGVLGAGLTDEAFVVFCQRVMEHNRHTLLCDKDYGHMGLGLGGLQKVQRAVLHFLPSGEDCSFQKEVLARMIKGDTLKFRFR